MGGRSIRELGELSEGGWSIRELSEDKCFKHEGHKGTRRKFSGFGWRARSPAIYRRALGVLCGENGSTACKRSLAIHRRAKKQGEGNIEPGEGSAPTMCHRPPEADAGQSRNHQPAKGQQTVR
jgi:hypothetical protein